jgi:hypothetical protein
LRGRQIPLSKGSFADIQTIDPICPQPGTISAEVAIFFSPHKIVTSETLRSVTARTLQSKYGAANLIGTLLAASNVETSFSLVSRNCAIVD